MKKTKKIPKLKVKELAMEKLRKTEGGAGPITGNSIIDIVLGFFIDKK